ncbi:hypothetical protein LF1_32690 [Rubripirellula obstinata]|uniref:Uncharacterized protein n=1 Tax=Rubripirellula obstinata TaxID=406547 RepID=A0A5B1CHR5_9BACT|nr:hypothetical protein [Rubripirellula obstinata]KAA1260728.1 hypothetical protein LF1_32690 [Rubripirellula obstinata]
MADPESRHRSPTTTTVEANLVLQQKDGDAVVAEITVSTAADGTLNVSSEGKLPSLSLREIGEAKNRLKAFSKQTSQDIQFQHNGRALASLKAKSSGDAKLSVHWWAMLRHLLGLG